MTSFGKGLAIKEVNGINCTRVGKAICVVYSGTIQKNSKRRCDYFSEASNVYQISDCLLQKNPNNNNKTKRLHVNVIKQRIGHNNGSKKYEPSFYISTM